MPSFTPSAVGGVVLRSGNLFVQEAFYGDALGFATVHDDGALRILDSEGGTLVCLEEIEGATPPPLGHTGLFHTALRFPTREELGGALRRLLQAGVRLTGASDHGVSEALYLNDPERNGVELYWDRPFEQWPRESDGTLAMFTAPLDVTAILRAGEAAASTAPARGDVGHVHLKVADIPRSVEFYAGVLGLNVQVSWAEAGFLAVGEYHHHVGANTWESRGAPPAPPTATGLERFELRLPDPGAAAERARAAGRPVEDGEGGPQVRDPDGIGVVLRS
jgi:catechol 2,3-dioxygenase